MTKLFQIGSPSDCEGLLPLVRIIKKGIFPIIQVGIPIILIVMGTIDLGKAVISSEEKEVKAAQGRLIKRCIYAVAIFFMVTLVTIVMGLLSKADDPNVDGSNNWTKCWKAAG